MVPSDSARHDATSCGGGGRGRALGDRGGRSSRPRLDRHRDDRVSNRRIADGRAAIDPLDDGRSSLASRCDPDRAHHGPSPSRRWRTGWPERAANLDSRCLDADRDRWTTSPDRGGYRRCIASAKRVRNPRGRRRTPDRRTPLSPIGRGDHQTRTVKHLATPRSADSLDQNCHPRISHGDREDRRVSIRLRR